MAEHSSFVNSCCPSRRGPPLVVSGSDNGTAKLWDMRQRGAIQTFPEKYQITAVDFSMSVFSIPANLLLDLAIVINRFFFFFLGGVDLKIKPKELTT